MKTIIMTAIMLSFFCSNAQFSVNIGVDPKLLLFGTDNQYTKHNSVVNAHFKIEYHGRDNDIYFAIGAEYANLREEYRAWFADFGKPFNFNFLKKEFTFIPQIEIGDIFRENINDEPYENIKWNDTYYYGINLAFRHYISNWFGIELEGSIDRATDLPHRDFRYGGKFNVIIKL